jgi:RNA polymerase sigma-70 factor (ECF subfamily)
MTASMMYLSAESATALDRDRSPSGPLGGRVRDPGAGSVRIDRDSQLIEALRLREPTAAEGLVANYGERAYRLTIGITGNKQDAEEAVQDAFWSVIRKIDTFRGESAFGSWVYRIVSNAAYAKVRRRPQAIGERAIDEALPAFDENGRHAGPLVDWSSRIDDPAVQTELRTVLSSALSELPAGYRAVIVMHDVEGWSMAEVANCLGITVATAKTRAHRARLLLRQRLSIYMAGEAPPVKVA